MASQLNITLIRKLRDSLMCLGYFIDMLSMDVCTARLWQTSGRLVQVSNVCTVSCSTLTHHEFSIKCISNSSFKVNPMFYVCNGHINPRV